MSTLNDKLKWQYRYFAQQSGKYFQMEEALSALGLLNIEDNYEVYLSPYGDRPSIYLKPKHVKMALQFGTGKLETEAVTLAEAARALLPKVGKWEKGFDSSTGEITLTATFRGVDIVLKDKAPKTCTVETVTEEVGGRYEPAYTRTRFRLKGDCDPLLDPR